jgi:hypothetical protein
MHPGWPAGSHNRSVIHKILRRPGKYNRQVYPEDQALAHCGLCQVTHAKVNHEPAVGQGKRDASWNVETCETPTQ